MAPDNFEQPEVVPPSPLYLNKDRVLGEVDRSLSLGSHGQEESINQTLQNAFTNPRFGLQRINPVIFQVIWFAARTIEPGYMIRSNDPETKAGAFVRGARIGNFVFAASFDYNPPTLTYEICEHYGIQIPEESDQSSNTLGVLENSCIEEGHRAYRHYTWLDDVIDRLGGKPAINDPNMTRSGAGYVLHLARFASGYVQYLAAQQELKRLDSERPDGLRFFDHVDPSDFL